MVVNTLTHTNGKPRLAAAIGPGTCNHARSAEVDRIASAGLDLVRPNQVPYVVGWLKHHAGLGHPEEALFSDILTAEGRQDWQIRQALDAVKLFREFIGDSGLTEHLSSGDDPLEILARKLRIP